MSNTMVNKLQVALYRLPWIKERWENKFKPIRSDTIPWTPLSKPLHLCKVALLTTGGVHLQSDVPFNMEDKNGDPSYRKIPSTATQEDLMITHDYYDHSDADQDINLVFPIDLLRKCQQEGLLGGSTDFFYSFMGHISGSNLKILIERTAKEVALELKRKGVDIALMVPA